MDNYGDYMGQSDDLWNSVHFLYNRTINDNVYTKIKYSIIIYDKLMKE